MSPDRWSLPPAPHPASGSHKCASPPPAAGEGAWVTLTRTPFLSDARPPPPQTEGGTPPPPSVVVSARPASVAPVDCSLALCPGERVWQFLPLARAERLNNNNNNYTIL